MGEYTSYPDRRGQRRAGFPVLPLRERPIRRRLSLVLLAVALGLWLGLLLSLLWPGKVRAECEPTPITEFTPTGIKGCVLYGEGLASWWGGPGVARNDCIWPWTDCTPIRITSTDTGLSITRTPTMFCDCYTGTLDERLVDLDPLALNALGLDPSKGLFRVTVQPATALPDTAMEAP